MGTLGLIKNNTKEIKTAEKGKRNNNNNKKEQKNKSTRCIFWELQTVTSAARNKDKLA